MPAFPRQAGRRAGVLLAVVIGAPASAAAVTCHIHPPSDAARPDQQQTIGPFEGRAACEAERNRRFGPLGRCHCSAPFTPSWVPGEPGSGAGSGGGIRPAETLLP